jgi:hypothetical protein
MKVKKKYSTFRKQVLDQNTLPSASNTEFNREVETVEKYYDKVNLVGFPNVSSYPMTASMWAVPDIGQSPTSIYFKGKTSFNVGYLGWAVYGINSSHTIEGTITGSIYEKVQPSGQFYGVINSPLNVSGSYNSNGGLSVYYDGLFNLDDDNNPIFEGSIYTNFYTNLTLGPEFYLTISSASPSVSVFTEFIEKTSGPLFARLTQGVNYQKTLSLASKPSSSLLLDGYFYTHYKYKKQQFSKKEINSIDKNGRGYKWVKGSQNKKTTVDPTTGLLNNSEPVETKTI